MTKSSKLYSDSPSIKKDAEGKAGISKPSEADAENMGLEGNPINGSEGEMPVQVYQKMAEMLDRHSNEIKDMQKRHSKEASKLAESKKEDK